MKFSNSIAIGGPIAVGKSTLVGSLPFIPVQELNSNDELQNLLLEKMYEGDKIAPQIFQLDILLTRFDKYKNLSNSDEMHAFDRTIFEDYIFAKALLKNYENIWNYYESIWKDKVEEIINEIGIPKLYVLLTCNWDSFKERLFNRKREIEIKNFQDNEVYFKNMIETYEEQLLEIFSKFNIPFVSLKTDGLSKLEIIDQVKEILSDKGIL